MSFFGKKKKVGGSVELEKTQWWSMGKENSVLCECSMRNREGIIRKKIYCFKKKKKTN